MYDSNAIIIYTDGSAIPNPGCGGIGIVIQFPDKLETNDIEIKEGYVQSTNNRMEILAVIRALQWIKENRLKFHFTRVIIITDSEYVYNNHHNSIYWKKNMWKNIYGKPYENSDLWDLLLKERQKIYVPTEIKWEKGKSREVLKRVDLLAKSGAKSPTNTDYGFTPGKFTKSRTAGNNTAQLFPAAGQEKIIRVYRKLLYEKNHKQIYKITFDEYSITDGAFIKKYVAYRKDNDGGMKRNNCFKVIFNSDQNFPQIVSVKSFPYPKKVCRTGTGV